ncbi:hypothetical protein VTK73DRAFT_6728 [Phialemonium thermophilum]|uniref:Clock-controlled protein 8 n=1 Tax=Phialemonium thermophilum TaxID=223376 RepID=A0ABR3WI05_9PEZI
MEHDHMPVRPRERQPPPPPTSSDDSPSAANAYDDAYYGRHSGEESRALSMHDDRSDRHAASAALSAGAEGLVQLHTRIEAEYPHMSSSHHPLPMQSSPMPSSPSYSPPSYRQTPSQAHDPASLAFPEAPTTELPPIRTEADRVSHSDHQSLPSLSTVAGSHLPTYPPPPPSSQSTESSSVSPLPPPPRVDRWPSLNPLTAYYNPSHVQGAPSPQRMDIDASSSGTATLSAPSPDRLYEGRGSSISLDDPDVRMAAEALGDLRADFVSTPPKRDASLPAGSGGNPPQSEEPLLSLLTSYTPRIATHFATSVYQTTTDRHPILKSSAKFIEGAVSGGMRWFIGPNRRDPSSSTSDLESGDDASSHHKRRKLDGSPPGAAGGADLDAAEKLDQYLYDFPKRRRTSLSTVDTLPPYDDLSSPAYTETADPQNQAMLRSNNAGAPPQAWQRRLITSTSGLSIAMSDQSLRCLRYCLLQLRSANEYIRQRIVALKDALDQYDASKQGAAGVAGESSATTTTTQQQKQQQQQPQANRSELAARISALKMDVLKALEAAIDVVSRYAGGALPENARDLIHRHLTSLPQRFHLARMQELSAQRQDEGSEQKEKAVREGGHVVLVLAREGLDMMSQVSNVLDGTIVSAEEWCTRLGKRKTEEREGGGAGAGSPPKPTPMTGVEIDRDVKSG